MFYNFFFKFDTNYISFFLHTLFTKSYENHVFEPKTIKFKDIHFRKL